MRVLGIIMLFCSSLFVNAQEAESLIDTNRILIGGQVQVSIMLTTKAQDTVIWPALPDSLTQGVEVLSSTSIDTSYDSQDIGTKLYSQGLIITSFDSGYYVIPPFYFLVNGKEVKSNPFLLTVGTIPLDTSNVIRDIKGPIPVDYGLIDWATDNWHWISLAALLILIISLTIPYFEKRRKQEPKPKPEKPKEPAHLIANRKLKLLEEKRLWQASKVKAYHSELSEIIREYLELRFDIHALEQTTDEIMQSLRFSELKEQQKSNLKKLLFLSDLVKFAKEKPLPEENEQSLRYAYLFVEESKLESSTKLDEDVS